MWRDNVPGANQSYHEVVLAELYISDEEGNDAMSDGTKEKPF